MKPLAAILAASIVVAALAPASAGAEPRRPATFSIVAADPEAGEVGVAERSRG